MEVNIKQEDRKYLTLEDGDKLPMIRRAVDDDNIIFDCRVALGILDMSSNSIIYKKDAWLKKNPYANDSICKDSGKLDVWIEFAAFDEMAQRFVQCGVYLTDIWSYTTEFKEQLKNRMWINEFVPVGNKGGTTAL